MLAMKKLQEYIYAAPDGDDLLSSHKYALRWKKKVIVTHYEELGIARFRLSKIDQDVFTRILPEWIVPSPGRLGKLGWINVQIDKLSDEVLFDLLQCSINEVERSILIIK